MKFFTHIRSLLIATAASVICADSLHAEEISDPLEPANRVIFTFNEYMDMLLLKPTAQAYDFVVPDPGKQAVTNVLRNLQMPVYFANSVLQGDPENAFSAFWSFMLNSTLGIAGIFDFAGAATDLQVRREDFGQTLGVWGFDEGPYIVLPFLGPSNMRDTVGWGGDFFTDPYNFIIDDDGAIIARIALMAIDARYRNMDTIDELYETSLDPYATFRSVYTQQRKAMVANTQNRDISESEEGF